LSAPEWKADKEVPMRRIAVATGLVLAFAAGARAQTWSAEQQEIWRLEEQQWKMGAAKDLSWIDSMTHPNLVYWDNDVPAPQNRASLARWSKYQSGASTTLEQELYPLALTITGNVGVAQYYYRAVRESSDKKRTTVTGRYTDVFVKEGGRWLFITWAGGDDPAD
jgi:hypothetical protein